ncbi:MAG: substrate-binding domain-containing protein [Anaerolineae bacterium]|nr:substrate-binding domain-containing protein [Anaerolineae bacterium]
MKDAHAMPAPAVLQAGPGSPRPTIAYLTPHIDDAVGEALWSGVGDAAQELGANLISYVGAALPGPLLPPSAANSVYDLVDTRALDGIISWASSLCGALDRDQVVLFHRRYHPLPVVSITLPVEGCPSVSIDSYQGMFDLIAHLIQVHGYRRLAFIRGPEGHYHAQERYRAYATALEEHGIPFDPNMVTAAAEFGLAAGVEGIRLLLDGRGLRPALDLDAIVTVSDLPALGALTELQARGIKVPDMVALVGFNDVLESRFVTPPLTSVRLPFYEQGRRAVEMLLDLLNGDRVPERVVLPASLRVRQSCGCVLPAVVQVVAGECHDQAPGSPCGPLADALAARREMTIEAMMLAAEARADMAPSGLAAMLFDPFVAEVTAPAPAPAEGAFLQALDHVVGQIVVARGQVQSLQNVLSAMRRCLVPCLGGGGALRRAEDLWGQARVLVAEATQRARGHQMVQRDHRAAILRQVSQSLVTTFDVAELADVLVRQLPRLEIDCCYLSLYQGAREGDPGVHDPTGTSRLILGCDERGRIEWQPDESLFPSMQLTPGGILHAHKADRPCSWVVEPLYFREERLGFVLFGVGPRDGTIYEVLRGQISSSLKGALLFDQARTARAVAEKADRLKTRLLANVSHELRTPLNVIISCAQEALNAPAQAELRKDLVHIHDSAQHQLRVINDLLDLSRAEIGELDIYLEFLDPGPLLEDVFDSVAATGSRSNVTWHLRLPDRLPTIHADPVRLRQILLNLLGNAARFVEQGEVVLGAQVTPAHLRIWVQDTGPGIPLDMQERIFEPFVTGGHVNHRLEGAGLGLSIARRLVALHGGFMKLESRLGQGSSFHVYLPLPTLSDHPPDVGGGGQPVLLLISVHEQPPAEIVEFSQRQGWAVHRLEASDDLEAVMQRTEPAAIAWDLANATPGDWHIIRRMRNHPRLSLAPFLLYGQESGQEAHLSIGLTDFVLKSADGGTLMDAISRICPAADAGPVLIVDDDPQILDFYQQVVARACPGYRIRTAANGAAALACLGEERPSLVILDLMMPEMDGFDVLDWMRANETTRRVPVLILSNRVLTLDDLKRIERHALVTLQSKGILTEDETLATLHRILFGTETLPAHTSALVKRAVAYLQQNYGRPLSRWEMADAIDVSEDYFSRVFRQELGISPWDYLNRYRIVQAMDRLRHTNDDITTVARCVGFHDPAYFSRVFRRVTGQSPTAYRQQAE